MFKLYLFDNNYEDFLIKGDFNKYSDGGVKSQRFFKDMFQDVVSIDISDPEEDDFNHIISRISFAESFFKNMVDKNSFKSSNGDSQTAA